MRLDKKTSDHILKVFSCLGVVGDDIEYINQSRKEDGYKVIDGEIG